MEISDSVDVTELGHGQQQLQQHPQQQEGPGLMEGTPVKMDFSTHACSVLSDLREGGLLCDAVIKVCCLTLSARIHSQSELFHT